MKEHLQELKEGGRPMTKNEIKNKELKNKLEKIKEIIYKYNIGKYDYSIPPIGIIELKQLLGDKEND